MTPPESAKGAGRDALGSLKVRVSSALAGLMQRDPERLASAIEMGLVSRSWLERPGEAPVSEATPMEVMERYLERSVEQKPSLLPSLGLSALQVLSWRGEDTDGRGVPATLTVAFTDLEGFTRFTSSDGDAAASELLTEHHRAVGPVIRSRGGRIVKRLGDGFLLTFPTPESAVLACLELVDLGPTPLRLRAGIHVGEVVVSRDDVLGHVVNVAARVAESARGGQLLVTAEVQESAGELPTVDVGRCRNRRFKGIGGVVRVCEASARA